MKIKKHAFLSFLAVTVLLAACSPKTSNLPGVNPQASTVPAVNKPSIPTEITPPADILFNNGVILTMDQSDTIAQALAIRAGRIIAVGSTDEIMKLRGTDTAVIDLANRTLLPGFVDAHSHLLGASNDNRADFIDLQEYAIRSGITTITEMGVTPDLLDQLVEYDHAGLLRMRWNTYLLYNTNCGDQFDANWYKTYQKGQAISLHVRNQGVKIFADGGSCNVPAVSFEYPGGYGHGDLYMTQEQMNILVAKVQADGYQVAIHALGDRAIEQAMNAIAAALKGQPNTFRHRIEHNAVLTPSLVDRYSQIGIVPTIFGEYPTCWRINPNGKFKYAVPAEIGTEEWAWRGLLDANPGIMAAWHADYPVFSHLEPIRSLYGFVTRNEVADEGSICEAPAWLKAGAITVQEALRAMTCNSAYALFRENEIGSLESGKLADMVILTDNPLAIAPEKIKDIQVLMTMIDGKVEFCAAGSEGLCPSTTPAVQEQTGSTNLALHASVSASAALPESPASNAVDGSIDTIWSSGSGPEQWIQVDLGQSRSISEIRLTISQYPEGVTDHQIWCGVNETDLKLLHEFRGKTSDPQVLTFKAVQTIGDCRYLRVVTSESPSWVAWREIEVFGQ